MIFGNLTQKYNRLEAWLHDTLVADHALNLHQFILEMGHLIELLAERQPRDLLDVGCGGGQLAIALKVRYPHLQLTGIDLSQGQVERAEKRAAERDLDVRFEQADAQALPFPDQSFDIVYSFGSAKHWPEPLIGFSECWRVLRSGGDLLIADATSDASREQVRNFYELSGFPRFLKSPLAEILYQRMFRQARPVETYQQIAAEVGMPAGSVTQIPDMPAFLVRAHKEGSD